MVTIESHAEHQAGVTLVTATITAAAGPTRVTVESRLDGPVWPPRRQGEPTAGWVQGSDGRDSIEHYEGVVPEDGRLTIGFASPAEPAEPAIEVINAEPTAGETDAMRTPAAVLRGLGDPSPPSLIETDEAPATHVVEKDSDESPPTDSDTVEDTGDDDEAPSGYTPAKHSQGPEFDTELPPDLAAWLDATERRIECAEALEATASVEAATEALRECGGVEGARTLDARLVTDAEHLRTLADRAAALADRAESTTIATDALERLT